MKNFHKNPNFYYVIIPVICALWAMFTWVISLPAAGGKWEKQKKEFESSQEFVTQILEVAPEKLDYEKQEEKAKEFDYGNVVDEFAEKWKIPVSHYSLNVGKESKRAGKQTVITATLSIKPVDMGKFINFLSSVLSQWHKLQCDEITLTKQKTGKNVWKADVKLVYYF
ncbi:MAG TPA: hypothetical protein ENH94_09520 [Phycisphaerales bacterium]|nr:hypothetical protein [Phycisphaerales bacterium]